MGCKPVSEPSGLEEVGRRVEDSYRKTELGEELTEKGVLIVQWETAMNRWHSCGPRVRLFHGPRRRGGDR